MIFMGMAFPTRLGYSGSRFVLLLTLWLFSSTVQAFVEIPTFEQLQLLYPGFSNYGGTVTDKELWHMVGVNMTADMHRHNTAALRLSWTFNRYGGRHTLGKDPIVLPTLGRVSIDGKDGYQFIYDNTAFGPFLAKKYGNPLVLHLPNSHVSSQTLKHFLHGHKGIVRMVSYHNNHAAGHIGLWNCDHWYEAKDFTTDHHLIAMEMWETPDSICHPPIEDIKPHIVPQNPNTFIFPHQKLAAPTSVQHRVRDREKKLQQSLWVQTNQ